MAASAKYVIDIAANLDGEETATELDALTADLMGAGKSAEFFQQAIKSVSTDLRAAQQAAEQANGALAEGEEHYRQLEKAADKAAKAAERAAIKNGGVIPDDEAAKANAAKGALDGYTATLKTLEDAAQAANDEEKSLSNTLDGVKKISGHVDKSISGQAESYEKLGSALGSVGGPLGTLGQSVVRPLQGFSTLSASIGSARAAAVLGVVGFAAMTAAVLALTAAVVVGAVKVGIWAVELADSKRSADLAREGIEAMNPGVKALHGEIDTLAKNTGVAVPELDSIAKSLIGAGVSADRMKSSLKTAALAQAALGAEGASQYLALEQAATDAQKAVDDAAKKSGGTVDKELTEKLTAARAAADDFAFNAQSKLGGVVARQMQGIGAQTSRLTSNFNGLFSGLNIDPVLAGMAKIVDLFDENSVAGKALKTLFEGVFQPLIDNAEDAATVLEAFYLGFLIGATKVYIAIKPAIKAISEFFGFDDSSLLDLLGLAKDAGTIVAYVVAGLAAALGVGLVAAIGGVTTVFGPLIAAIYLGGKALGLLWDAAKAVIGYLTNTSLSQIATDIASGFVSAFTAIPSMLLGVFMSAVSAVLNYLGTIDLASIGTNIMLGMVRGVTAGVGAVVSAVKNAMSSAISAAKSVLGIASPSKVFEDEVGDQTVAGYTNALDDGATEVADSTEAMLAPAPAWLSGAPANDALKQAQLSGDVNAVNALQMQTSPSDSGAGGGAGAGGGSSGGGEPGKGGGPYVDLRGAQLTFQGVKDAPSTIGEFGDMLTEALEGDASKLGAGKAAA